MKVIPLNRGLVALVDAGDWRKLQSFRWKAWYAAKSGTFYARRITHYVKLENGTPSQRTRGMTEDIMGKRPGYVVDHRNGQPLDNRRRNLRWATRAQNSQNSSRRNKTGYKGVAAKSGLFQALICTAGRLRSLGYFKTKEEAAAAYNDAALHYFGEFARLNQIPKRDGKEKCPTPRE